MQKNIKKIKENEEKREWLTDGKDGNGRAMI